MTINLILHNAVVYTVDPQNPLAEAVACANGYIVAVGRNHEILPMVISWPWGATMKFYLSPMLKPK